MTRYDANKMLHDIDLLIEQLEASFTTPTTTPRFATAKEYLNAAKTELAEGIVRGEAGERS